MADSIEKLSIEWREYVAKYSHSGIEPQTVKAFEKCISELESALPAVSELIEAAKQLMADNEEYVRINNLGDPFHNHNMKRIRAALEEVEG
jgi:hypothetical protein